MKELRADNAVVVRRESAEYSALDGTKAGYAQ